MMAIMEAHGEGQFQGRYLVDGEHKGRSISFVGGCIQHAIPSCRSSVEKIEGAGERGIRECTLQASQCFAHYAGMSTALVVLKQGANGDEQTNFLPLHDA